MPAQKPYTFAIRTSQPTLPVVCRQSVFCKAGDSDFSTKSPLFTNQVSLKAVDKVIRFDNIFLKFGCVSEQNN
jgi:hypothetical protein